MEKRLAKRTMRELTAEEQRRLGHKRELIKQELPDLIRRDQLRADASRQRTLSGALRRAIHSSSRPVSQIAVAARLSAIALDEFLTGERSVPSDMLDRLAQVVGFQWPTRKAS